MLTPFPLPQCASFRSSIKALDDEILASGVTQDFTSESYLALSRKHEQKQQHLMEIINRQQKRINKAGAKIAGLEDEEASLRGFLDELEASKAMMKAGEKQEIVWHTIREIRASYKSAAVGREEAKAKAKEKEKAKEGGGGGGSGGGGGGR